MNMAMRTVVGVNVKRRRGRCKHRNDDSRGMFGGRQQASLDNEQANFGKHTDVPALSRERVHASLSNRTGCPRPAAAPTENRLCSKVET